MRRPAAAPRRPPERQPLSEQTTTTIATALNRDSVGVIDLTHPIEPAMPVPHGYPPVWSASYPSVLPDGAGVSELVLMGVHIGTHVDAPVHFAPDGQTIAELSPLAISGPCVVLDFHHEGGWQEVSARDIERWESETAEEIRAGDVVLIRTGHGRKWAAMPNHEDYTRGPWCYLGTTAL